MLLLALIAVGVPLGISLRDRVDSEVQSQAASQAAVVATSASEPLARRDRRTLSRLAALSRRSVGGRVLIVDRSGDVVDDSEGSDAVGADYGGRPEIADALSGASVQTRRDSETLGVELLATAVPVLAGGETIGAVRITQSVEAVNAAIQRSTGGLILLGSVVLLLGLIAGVLLASGIARPIRRLEQAAQRVSAGDLEARAAVEGSSEQRALASSFNEMTERISRLLKSQRNFVADASHQLRTPLTGVRLRLEELRETATDPDQAAQADAGMHEVDRLSHIVDELLILSRAGEHESPASEVSLSDAAERACQRWHRTAEERGIELELEDRDADTAWCARADLDRAIDALLENAINYSPRDSDVSLLAAGQRVEVLDRGPGIDAQERSEVFRRFYRGSAGRQGADGTGLGLPIARELVGQWGGSVRIEDRPGGGTRAVIELPAVRATVSS